MSQTDILHLTDTVEFEQAVAQGVSLVDFYADWCGPCKMLAPILGKVADTLGDQATILKVNVDHAPNLAAHFQVMGIPLLVVLKDGQEVQRLVGVQTADAIVNTVRQYI